MSKLVTEDITEEPKIVGQVSEITEYRKKYGVPVLKVPGQWLCAPTGTQRDTVKYFQEQLDLLVKGEIDSLILPNSPEITFSIIPASELE